MLLDVAGQLLEALRILTPALAVHLDQTGDAGGTGEEREKN